MTESIVLPLITEVAKPMVNIVVSRVTQEIHFFRKFKKELNDLQENVQMIASTVDKMPETADKAVEVWLRKALRIIHDVENVMDLLAYDKHRTVVMRRKISIRLVVSPLERVHFRRKMGSWIRRINTNIETALKDANTIHGLQAFVQSAASLQPVAVTNITDDQEILRQVRRNVDMSLFVGRDSDVDIVVDMLCNPAQRSDDQISSNRLSIIAIVGIGGMGKTTLAKAVYKNEAVQSHFSERIWISDLKDLNIESIMNQMVMSLDSLGMGTRENANNDITTRKLKERLGGRRYLLVLDDVWNTNQALWDSMKSALEEIGGSNDSMFLTTTRDNAVANVMGASIHHLLELREDDSWSLFNQTAFAKWSHEEILALQDTGRKIVEKCKGVPLAIKSIAGILNKERSPHKWTNIEKSELWDIPHDGTGVLPSLKLSYNHLSSPMLKKCFSLCAYCPKGWSFGKTGLVSRWGALGLLRNSSNQNTPMEDDVGEEYLKELLSISFLLVKERDEVGEAIHFHLHDMVHDLAKSVAMHERWYLEAGKENKALDIQHITVVEHVEVTLDFPDKLVLENIHSLELLNELPMGLLVHVKYLRVLYISDKNIEVVPKSIARLKCLKLLDLGCCPIKLLPESIMELYNLQSLSLDGCKPLSRLPRGLSNLLNLRHLGLNFYLGPTEKGVIEKLIQLQTLPPLQLSEGGFQISELGCLHHVKGGLDIKGLQFIKSKLDSEMSKLSTKSRVEQLQLIWDNDDNNANHEEVLDGLHPNRNLKLLSLKGYGGDKFPPWLMRMNVAEDCNNGSAGTLCNLIKLELIDCRRCEQLPTMGHLPMLKFIEVKYMEKLKRIGPELYSDAVLLLGNSNEASSSSSSPGVKSMVYFASLKELRLSGLVNLEEWCEPASLGMWIGFPSLEVLVIEKCWKLKEAPSKYPVLKEFTVKCMESSKPLMKIMSNKSSVSFLTKLEIVNVIELTQIPEEVGECTSLQTLIIWWCPKLEWIPNLSGLGSLRQIELLRNDSLRGAPEGLESCKSLEGLRIANCGKVETLPDLAGLSRLRDLDIRGMREMIRQPPEWVYNLPSLRFLHIGNYNYNYEGQKEEFPDISCLFKITSLEELYVYGWEELQNLPEQLQYFTALKILAIVDFDSVEELPDWLVNLSSLQILCVGRCKRLKKLPSKEAMDRLRNFNYLEITDCPLLEKGVERDGPEHHKIASPNIVVEIINSTS